MGFFADLLLRIGADASDVKRELGAAKRDLQSFSQDLTSIGSRLTAGISIPLAGVGVAALKVAGELEQNAVAFKTMLGSAAAAEAHLKDLKQFALSTPFEFKDLTVASKRLQALGFDASRVIPILTNVGDAAAALGLGAEGIQRITTALGQMQAKGKVQAEEMRQLAEAGIPAWQILAKTLNTDVAGAMKLVEQRAVDSGQAVPAILAGINERFGGLMKEQSKTLLGQFSNLKDQITFTLQDLGKTLAPVAAGVMDNVLKPMLEGVKNLAAGFAAMPPGLQQATIGIAAFLAAAGPAGLVLGGITSGLSSIVSLALKLPALLNPVTMALTALATAAGIAFYELNKNTAGLRGLDETFSKFITGMVTMEKDFEYAHRKLTEALDNGAITLTEYNAALALLEDREKKSLGPAVQEMYGGFGVKLHVVGKEAKATSSAVEKLADSLEKLTFAQAKQKGLIKGNPDEIAYLAAIGQQWGANPKLMPSMEDLWNLPGSTDVSSLPTYNRNLELARDTLGAVVTEADLATRNMEELSVATGKSGGAFNLFKRQVSTVVSDLGRSLTDVVFRTKSIGDAFKDTGKAIVRIIAEDFINAGLGKLVGFIKDTVLPHLGSVGKALAGILGGGASGAAGQVAGSAGGAASTAGGAGSAASGAASGVMGAIGAIGAAVGAVSSVVGNFQMHGMNKSLDLLVNHTLRSFNVQAQTLDFLYTWNTQWFARTSDMWNEIRNVVAAIKAGGSAGGKGSVTFNNCSFTGTSPQAMMEAAFEQFSLAQGNL